MTTYLNPSTRSGGAEQIIVTDRSAPIEVEEAPFDDTEYVRINGGWKQVSEAGLSPDTLAPDPPSGLSASGDINSAGTGVDYELSWTAPTTNVDDTPLTDLAYYVVRWRYAGYPSWSTFVSNDNSAMLTGLILGMNVEWSVLARDASGNDSTWANNTITGTTDSVGPAQPSAPTASTRLGSVMVTWDGLDVASDPPPIDFDRTDVYMSATTGGPWALIGSLYSAGSVVVADIPVGEERFFSMISVDESGNASPRSAEVAITVQGITAPDFEANAITANMIGTGSLAAAVAITGYLLAGNPEGSRVVMDGEGIRQYDDAGNLLTMIPTDPDLPSSFEGAVIANSLTVRDNMLVQGQANQVDRGAVLEVSGGTTAPTSSASVAVDYQKYNPGRWSFLYVPMGTHGNLDDTPDVYATTHFFYSSKFIGPSNKSWEVTKVVDSAGIERAQYSFVGSVAAIYNASGERVVIMCERTASAGAVTAGSLSSFDFSTMSSDGSTAATAKAHRPMTSDYFNYYQTRLGRCFSSSPFTTRRDRVAVAVRRVNTYNDIVLRQYVVSESAFTQSGTDLNVTIPFANIDESLIGVTFGSSEKMGFPGTNQDVWLVHSSTKTYAYNTSGTRLPELDFPTPAGAAAMNAYGDLATNEFLGFRTVEFSATSPVTKLTNNHWNDSTSSKWWVSTTYFDSDPAGTGQHETNQGPRVSLTVPKRGGITVTAPPVPSRPFPTTQDDPLSSKIYIGRGEIDPTRTYMEYAGVVTDPDRVLQIGDFTFPAGLAASPPPAASDFPSSSPAVLKSAGVPGWTLSGDGSAEFGDLNVTGDFVLANDQGWTTVAISNTTNFALYDSLVPIQIRRAGDQVFLRGQLSLTAAGATKIDDAVLDADNLAFVIPANMRPSGLDPVFVCQGSANNRWSLRVQVGGNCYIHRYGPGASSSSVWLPFYVSWMLG